MSQIIQLLYPIFELMIKVHQILTTLIILPLFLVGTFHYSFVTFNFQLNRDYITQEFCVNKDKPQLECGGQCHFMQQMGDLKKADEERSGDTQSSQDERPINLFISEISLIDQNRTFKQVNYPTVSSSTYDGYSQLFETPPRA